MVEKTPVKKILIVDDDPGNLFIMETRLEEKGYAVFSAENGEEALVAARAKKPDVIILDIMMPKMDGTELAQRLKQLPELKEVPIFFVTCLQTKEEEVKPGFVVGRRIFAKPVDIDKLVDAIKKSLG
jgi:two-component system alkaline phosphatase synthesis response regulator PhoP